MKIAYCSERDLFTLRDDVRAALQNCHCLEEAAQTVVNLFFDWFAESIVLVRLFATIPYGVLPQSNQNFVQKAVYQKAAHAQLDDNTLVLSLLASRGVQEEWNHRSASKGHIGIPLISTRFIENIPMVARLLNELEVNLDWFDSRDGELVKRNNVGTTTSLFYVNDATTTVDAQGRHVIPAQDFVAENNVKTVFGVGGIYVSGAIFTLVVFTRDEIPREVIEQFSPMVITIKVATEELEQKHQYFMGASIQRQTVSYSP